MKLNRKSAFAVIMTAVMCVSATGCNSSGEMSDKEIQALIDSAVASAEQEADRVVEEAIKDAEEQNAASVVINSSSEFAPSDEILSADMYSGKVQIEDTVFTYPFTLNDLEAAGIDTGITLDDPAGSYFQDMIMVGNGYIQIGCHPTDSFLTTKGESVVTFMILDCAHSTPDWYLPGGITKNSPKSLVTEKYGNESFVEETSYMYYEEYAVVDGEPYPLQPSNSSYAIHYDSNDKVRSVTVNLDINSEKIVEWKFNADSYKDEIAVYISTPEYFFDYIRMVPYNYGMKLYEYNGEQYLLRIDEKPDNKGKTYLLDNNGSAGKLVYNYPADYSEESAAERIERTIYEKNNAGEDILEFEGSFTYSYKKVGDQTYDIVRRLNSGSIAKIYGERHDGETVKRFSVSVTPCNGTTTVSDEALASLDKIMTEAAASIRFEAIEKNTEE